jgi:hypothetical protein
MIATFGYKQKFLKITLGSGKRARRGGEGKHRGQDSRVFRVLSVNTKSTRARKHKTPMSGARAVKRKVLLRKCVRRTEKRKKERKKEIGGWCPRIDWLLSSPGSCVSLVHDRKQSVACLRFPGCPSSSSSLASKFNVSLLFPSRLVGSSIGIISSIWN